MPRFIVELMPRLGLLAAALALGLGTGAASAQRLPAQGVLVVESEPANAAVLVDGVRRGQTPAVVSVGAGERAVRVALAGYAPFEETLRVGAGDTARVASRLVRLNGRLAVDGLPPGATATVNGAPATPVTPTGLATVVVDVPGQRPLRAVVPVASGAETRVVYEPAAFRPERAALGVLAPGVLQIRDGRPAIGALYTAAVAGGLAAALAASAAVDRADSRIGLARGVYDAAGSEAAAVAAREELSRLVSASRASRLARGAGLVAAGLVYAISVADSFARHVRRPALVMPTDGPSPLSVRLSGHGASLSFRL